MKESNMQTLFGKYIRSRKPKRSAVFELKICKGTSLPFDALKDHQIKALLEVREEGFYHKLIDPPAFKNMIEAGIIDATSISTTAIETAVSVSTQLSSLGCAVVIQNDEK